MTNSKEEAIVVDTLEIKLRHFECNACNESDIANGFDVPDDENVSCKLSIFTAASELDCCPLDGDNDSNWKEILPTIIKPIVSEN